MHTCFMQNTLIFHRRRIALVAALMLIAATGVAAAHVDSSPRKIKAGSAAVVTFTIPHGCDGSATTGVDIKIPAEITDAAAVAPKGWKGTVTNSVAVFSGGVLAAKAKGKFTIKFTAPDKIGVLSFPTVQRCVKGKTLWVEPANSDSSESSHPAPTVRVVAK
jgi:periplasmic copper chaperone A